VLDGDDTAEVRLRKEDFSTGLAEQINALIRLVADSRGASSAREPGVGPQDDGEPTPQGQVDGDRPV